MSRTQQWTVCSRTEVMLLLELAREHAPHIRLHFEETPRELKLSFETDSPELHHYLTFMLRRLRAQQRAMEAQFAAGDGRTATP